MDAVSVIREYYRTIDEGDYETLSSILTESFTQERSDRRFDGRDSFVAFMKDERPRTDTEHDIDRIFETSTREDESGASQDDEIAVEGAVYYPDGERWFGFVDVFEIKDDRLASLRTYTK
ncbi:MAG: nuclear transport factor 2 family protein [Halodesulfurarchaeum sp.]